MALVIGLISVFNLRSELYATTSPVAETAPLTYNVVPFQVKLLLPVKLVPFEYAT
jgi:hypothetical protein